MRECRAGASCPLYILSLTFSSFRPSYYNVIQARRKSNKPILEPLLGLLPYFVHTSLLVLWLAGPEVQIVESDKILWFTFYWAAT